MTSQDVPAITWGPAQRFLGGAPDEGARTTRRSDFGWASRARVDASFALMDALVGGCTLVEALVLVADQALLLAEAQTAFIALPAEQPNTLAVDIAVGIGAGDCMGLTVQISRSLLGRAYSSRRAIASRIASGTGDNQLPAGPILLVPLDTGEAARGVLAVASDPHSLPFGDPVRRHLIRFATASASLIEVAEERRATHPAPEGRGRLRSVHTADQP
jgi:hypothetical protein